MQIVIDIPEEVKYKVYNYGLSLCPSDKDQLIHAIVNGTPLPKGHGELIDRGALPMEVQSLYDIRLASTIIEADRGTEK